MFAAVYKINYTDFLNLPIHVFLDMYNNWNISAGLNSGVEAFQISSKEFTHRLTLNTTNNEFPKQKPSLKKRLDEIKKAKGKDKLNINEVWGLLEANSK